MLLLSSYYLALYPLSNTWMFGIIFFTVYAAKGITFDSLYKTTALVKSSLIEEKRDVYHSVLYKES